MPDIHLLRNKKCLFKALGFPEDIHNFNESMPVQDCESLNRLFLFLFFCFFLWNAESSVKFEYGGNSYAVCGSLRCGLSKWKKSVCLPQAPYDLQNAFYHFQNCRWSGLAAPGSNCWSVRKGGLPPLRPSPTETGPGV